MSKNTQGSLSVVGAIAAGIFLIAFLALMVLGDYGFFASAFMAILIALLSAIILYLGFDGSAKLSLPSMPSKSAPKPKAEKAAVSQTAPSSSAAKPETAPKTVPADRGEDYDGDGVLEGTDEGTRPAGLDAPRGGTADDLKQIKGIGPKLEKLCNSMGFWHFDQIAAWSADEVAWVDANLQGFKGRVSRDNWIEQARVLAAGGQTDFSKRVEGGDVY